MKRTEELEALYSGEVTKDNNKWYIHIELLPKLTKMRKEGQLLHNQTKKIQWAGDGERDYYGDTDLDGKACGWGTATSFGKSSTGTFLNDEAIGIVVQAGSSGIFVSEFYEAKFHGYMTYYRDNIIENV